MDLDLDFSYEAIVARRRAAPDTEFDAIKKPEDITLINAHLIPPRNKFDASRVELLPQVDPSIWTPVIAQIFDWTCDPNWPSTHDIIPALASNSTTIEACIPEVRMILSGTDEFRDDEHQHVLLADFIPRWPMELQVKMLDVIREFRRNLTEELEEAWEWEEWIDEMIVGLERWEAEMRPRPP